ncbi:MAG TPA: hypothetical protein VHB79_04810 [Polyangiaceae bacterium]|nr:hypothetical protein [Polyangiaceae bacterium]
MDAPLSVLQWDRGALEAECDRGAIIQAGVEAYLGRTAFGPDGTVVVRVKLARVQENGRTRVVARVTQETSDGQAWGEREVAGDSSCASLDEPLTLVVALLVDAPTPPPPPVASEPPSASAPPPAPPSPKPEEPADPDGGEIETAPSLEQATTAPQHVVVLAFGLVSLGGLPTTGGGAGLLGSFKPRGFWGLGVEAGAWLPQRLPLGTGSLETSLLVFSGSVCPLQGVSERVWWSACGSLGAGRLHAKSRHLLEARTRSDWFALPGASVRGGRVFGQHVLISAGLEALFPVSPDSYVYRSADGEKQLAFEPSRLMITAQLGVGLLLD